ncbi:MAG: HAD family phosphatase [Treponema sp.]|jgi:HAD superfamily hydrolase (TIGR01509 family)|nr:HAD family phosphatase [Treponema sp.]
MNEEKMKKGPEENAGRFSPKAAILDMDGLMLDTEGPTVECWLEICREFGLPVSRDTVIRAIGINEPATRALFLGEYGRNFPFDEIYREVIGLMKRRMDREGIRHRPGLSAFLDCLAERGIPFAVATSTGRETALWKLEKAGLRGRFPLMVCGDEVKNGKPAPDIFLAAAARLGVNPADCAGFEDSGPGLLGLAAAGIRSVFIRDIPEPSPEALAGVWRRCGDLAEAREIFISPS